MILLEDSEGPDQTAWIYKLIWAFTILICQRTHFPMAQAIYAQFNQDFANF